MEHFGGGLGGIGRNAYLQLPFPELQWIESSILFPAPKPLEQTTSEQPESESDGIENRGIEVGRSILTGCPFLLDQVNMYWINTHVQLKLIVFCLDSGIHFIYSLSEHVPLVLYEKPTLLIIRDGKPPF